MNDGAERETAIFIEIIKVPLEDQAAFFDSACRAIIEPGGPCPGNHEKISGARQVGKLYSPSLRAGNMSDSYLVRACPGRRCLRKTTRISLLTFHLNGLHRIVTGGASHTLPQGAPQAFAKAPVEVNGKSLATSEREPYEPAR